MDLFKQLLILNRVLVVVEGFHLLVNVILLTDLSPQLESKIVPPVIHWSLSIVNEFMNLALLTTKNHTRLGYLR